MSGPDPFTILGLAARPDLTDDDIRAAWRRIAAAVHPDRADGGDPARFSAAATAFTALRTLDGRREAFADLAAAPRRWSRFRRGRPAVLVLRTAVAAGVSACALAVACRQPGEPRAHRGRHHLARPYRPPRAGPAGSRRAGPRSFAPVNLCPGTARAVIPVAGGQLLIVPRLRNCLDVNPTTVWLFRDGWVYRAAIRPVP